MEIKNVETLAEPLLQSGETFVSYECQNLLSPGENYGSIMLLIQIKVSNDEGEERLINCVAKTCPPPGFLWEVFNIKVTFKKEIALYDTIVPALNDFGRAYGFQRLIDFVAECKGARISLDPHSDEVDEDAVLLLENLKVQGFEVGNRFIGFDLATTELLLRDLATLHASVIAYKTTKGEEFNTKILPYLSKHRMVEISEDVEKESYNKWKETFLSIPECAPHWPKLEVAIINMKESLLHPPETDEIFRTLTHNDFWVNNTMVRYENGKPVANKMVDFQIIEHTSLANDIVFFLYSSVDLSVLEEHLDDLFQFYYDSFIKVLRQLDVDTSVYSFKAMMEEFGIIAKAIQFMHVTFMMLPIMTLKGKAKDLSEMEINDILAEKTSLHENYYKRIKFVVLDFIKRDWL